ncbi:MAG TPA: toll/interleukin-1 receptor domain-containing protein, partial [Candidatus Competibacter sp.]|nr:toll/interleukin-1 receptor domain-containing protein [Candidatus Competibacter sp.]
MATASIFICHAPSDTAFARDLELALETFRLSVWRDNRGLRGDNRLAPMVRWAIEQARQVIVVLGLNTGQLAWLRREIELAQEIERRRESGYHVIPLLLPGTDKSILGQWFSPIPTTAPIQLPADGLGAVLPALLAALGESPPGDVASGRNSPPPVAFELDFSRANALAADWQWTVRLGQRPEPTAIADLRSASGALPSPPPHRLQHWHLPSSPCSPTAPPRA